MRWWFQISKANRRRLFPRPVVRRVPLIFAALSTSMPALAQSTPASVTTPAAARSTFNDIHRDLARGQALLDANDPRAEPLLRSLSQQALDALNAIVGLDVLASTWTAAATDGAVATAMRQTAQAHHLWGVAADRASQRDIAITALARATRLAGSPANGTNLLARESQFLLSGILRQGLPLVSSDDVLDTIARTVHGNLWSPQRFRFELPTSLESPSVTPPDAARSTPVRELLITSGRLFPPLETSTTSTITQVIHDNGTLARIPPLYRAVSPAALPRVLKLDRMVVGYAREIDGPNRGMWRQVVRVYYPSTFLTRNERDDRPRAEALCAQFLKVHAMMRAGLGLDNPYAGDGVTTVWLSEVSAWWPKDDEDPAIQTALGLVMPPLNIVQPGEEIEINSTPRLRPWYAAGQVDSAPGEIMFFKMTEPREESEWLREVIHEYGHIALPPVGGFKPPLEPYGNGEIGETLGMMWLAAQPVQLLPSTSVSPPTRSTPSAHHETPDEFRAEIEAHVARTAIPALRFWKSQGPNSALISDGTSKGLDYLKGLAVYLDRVYGAPVLGAACKPLVAQAQATPAIQPRLKAVTATSLLKNVPLALREPFAVGVKTFPIWLGGALQSSSYTPSAAELSSRAPLRLRGGERATAWLYVPPTASALTLAWKGVQPSNVGTLRVEGTWKALPASQPAGADGALRLGVAGRGGWHQFTFVSSHDIVVNAAWFER